MKPNRSFQRLRISSLALGAVLASAQWQCHASPAQQQEQQQSQSQQPPPSAPRQTSPPTAQQPPEIGQLPVKRRKVWTNDEVVSLRTPADNYVVEREAKEAADAKAAAKEAAIRAAIKSEKDPPLDIRLPSTPEETEKMLKNTQDDIQEETVVLDKLHQELLDTSTGQQAEKQKEIDRLTANVATLRRDAKALREHLRMLREKSQGENPPPASQPPSV